MTKRSPGLYLQDILASMDKIERYTEDLSFREFTESEMVVDAVIRNLEIIGEASTHIPADMRLQYSDIPWSRMVGLRNIAIHEYFGVDLEIIWVIVTENIPDTRPKIEAALEEVE